MKRRLLSRNRKCCQKNSTPNVLALLCFAFPIHFYDKMYDNIILISNHGIYLILCIHYHNFLDETFKYLKESKRRGPDPICCCLVRTQGSTNEYSSVGAEALAQHVLYLLQTVCAITPTEMGLKMGQSQYSALQAFHNIYDSFTSKNLVSFTSTFS